MNNNNCLNWIFNNCSVNGEYCYIHFPLNLMSKNQLSIESYADSIKEFLNLLDLKIYCKVIDSAVVEFPEKSRINIQNTAISKIYSESFLYKIREILKDIHKNYPILCIELEKNIFTNKNTEYNLFKKLYEYLTVLIAVNYLNSVVENQLTFILNNNDYASEVEKHLYKNNFSHMTYFNNELNKLKPTSCHQEIVDFCWNVGFVEDAIGDGSKFKDVSYVQNILSINQEFAAGLNPSRFYYPKIELNEIKNIDNEIDLILSWTSLLQTNLEFRHYWGLRFLSNAQYLLENKNNMTTWTLKDYERKYFKIK